MSTFTIIMLIIIMILIISDVYFLWKIFKTARLKKKSLPDERYFELKYNINLLKAVSAILIFLLGFLGFTTYKDITNIVESDFEEKFKIQEEKIKNLDSIVKNYESLVESIKSEEGKSIENLNDVKREFGLINRKVAQTYEALKYTTKVYVTKDLEYVGARKSEMMIKFSEVSTIYGEELPTFKRKPAVFATSRVGSNFDIKEVTKDYVVVKMNRFYLSEEENPKYQFNLWIAETN